MIEAKVEARVGEFLLDAEIQGGGVICLVGKNGSGKTTLIRAIAGLLPITDGFVKVGGMDVTTKPVGKRDVVLVTPSTCIPHLAVDSHLLWGARLRGLRPPAEYIERVKSELGIDFEGIVGHLSRGMRQRVALSTALLSAPKAILVDEAFLGLNDRESLVLAFGKLARDGAIDTVFSSQDEADESLADLTYVMNNGMTAPKKSILT